MIRVGALDDLPDGRGVRVDVDGSRIAVFRLGSDVYAVGDRCSHAEASLSDGEVYDGTVECPRHGAEFDLTTGEGTLPASRPVRVYATELRDGDVFLSLEEVST